MSTLRILQICASHGQQIGGMEKQVLAICHALSKEPCIEIHLAAGSALIEQADNDISSHTIPSEKSRNNPALKNTVLGVIERVKPHLIHAHGMKAAALLKGIPPNKECKRLVSIHGDKKDLRSLKHFDACIGVSQEIYSRLQSEGLPAVLIENGIAAYEGSLYTKSALCQQLKLAEDLPLLLCAGRLVPVKRYELAMRACRDLPVNLVIAGDGPLLKQLQQLTTERIRLIGERDDVPALMTAADAVLSVSEREGMSLSMLEALSAGTPVLSTPVSGAASILPDLSLIHADTPEALAHFLSQACSDLERHKKAQSAVFEAVRNEFTQEAMISRTKTLYRELMRRSELLFLGDCNTCGTEQLSGSTYPELVGNLLEKRIQNCGQTMATTREAIRYVEAFGHEQLTALFLQYGLVDSWMTIRCAPYVLYYPDSPGRRFLRRWVKKWKKYGRKFGLGRLFGMRHQVPIDEFKRNISGIIETVNCQVFLIETAPNHDHSRNPAIQAYNAALAELADRHEHVHLIRCYEEFHEHMDEYYLDPTHFSATGHARLAELITSHPLLGTP